VRLRDKVVDVNLKGTFLCCQVAVEQVRKQGGGGKIVNVSALAGRWLGSLAGCHYTAAKAGVIGLTRHLAHELGPEGIYVNAIAPTITLASQRTTDLWDARSDEYKAKVLSEIPLRRLSTPQEVAAGVIFLCSDEASYLTGVTLDINGGRFFSQQADEKRPSAALPSFLVVAAYFCVRLTSRNFGCLASGRF
jgi:NAD(P)-dependent dehydrogenase (short-subunit alcohol dehydrogenase family)